MRMAEAVWSQAKSCGMRCGLVLAATSVLCLQAWLWLTGGSHLGVVRLYCHMKE